MDFVELWKHWKIENDKISGECGKCGSSEHMEIQ